MYFGDEGGERGGCGDEGGRRRRKGASLIQHGPRTEEDIELGRGREINKAKVSSSPMIAGENDNASSCIELRGNNESVA